MIIGLVILLIAIGIMVRQTFSRGVPPMVLPTQAPDSSPFKISSPALSNDGSLPSAYTCSGSRISPPISIDNPPSSTKEFVLIMHNPDAETGDVTHWVVWGIPPETTIINENLLPTGAVVGKNDKSLNSYDPPCAIEGANPGRYVFDVYALNESIKLDDNSTKDRVIAAINGQVISKAQFSATLPDSKK